MKSSKHALARAWRRAFEKYQSVANLDFDPEWKTETMLSLLDRWNQREMQIALKFERLYPDEDLYDTAYEEHVTELSRLAARDRQGNTSTFIFKVMVRL